MPKKNLDKKIKTQKPEDHKKPERYFEGIGRRKTSVARVRIYSINDKGKKLDVVINNRPLADYFRGRRERQVIMAPFVLSGADYHTTVRVLGGGVSSQAEAVRLGISRALILAKPELRPKLKVVGFLKRDPRMVERKKAGFRKARRPQQWRKR